MRDYKQSKSEPKKVSMTNSAEEEPAVLSVSMTKSDGGFGLGFIMEDIVLVNRVDPGGQAQVRP